MRTLLLASMVAMPIVCAAQDRMTVQPVDNGAALVNPGMGWTFHYYSNIPTNYGSKLAPWDTLDDFPGLTVTYLRIPWSYLEPEEGAFNWSVVDGPAQRWIAKGKQIALRITCSESWMRYATPKWVEEAGAEGHNFTPGKMQEDGPFWEPDYDDPVFLEKLDNFLAAMAARYDGSPEVAFIDVGSFGVWGEGHVFASTQKPYPSSTIIKHIDLHLKHFPNTLLVANDDYSFQGDESIEYAIEKGLALRDDSILVQPGDDAYYHAGMAQEFWRNVPVILECEHYGGSRDRGNWQDGSLYIQAVEEYHASYAAIHWWPEEFLEENRDLIHRINQRLGYRLQLAEASWPSSVRPEETFDITMEWRNAGVAPCYGGGHPAITLKAVDPVTGEEGIATVFAATDFDVTDLPVGAPGEAAASTATVTASLPFYVRPGAYRVYVSVGEATGTPKYQLPFDGDDGQGRYLLGSMDVSADYDVVLGPVTEELGMTGGTITVPLLWSIQRPGAYKTEPFCHLVENGRIAYQGTVAPTVPEGAFDHAGDIDGPVIIGLPDEARGRSFELIVGLWMPERMAQPDERLLPYSGDTQSQVRIGTVAVAENGEVTLTGL